ncbi:MAG: hypothetical protein SH808_13135 [Saprospiraceae bacterium]|nr:hypothetical protein [Saprospiraceae bacterium]
MDNNLLEKYWNAETSSREEDQLLQDLNGSNSPDGVYFTMISEARQQKSKLTIDDIKTYNHRQSLASSGPVILPLYRWIASAAAIISFVVASIGIWNYSQQSTQSLQMAETFEDPYAAYEEVREALAFVSAKLNKSQSAAMLNIQKAGEYAEMFK